MKKIFYIDISNITLNSINLLNVSEDRLEKANKIKDENKKLQSLISYLLLRYAFSELDIKLEEYEFYYMNNKPFIKDLNYYFNITHSHNIVAIAISDTNVGIDCEFVNYEKDLTKVAKYALTIEEYSEFLALNKEDSCNYFYQKWVMKESYFKMLNKGLTKEFSAVSLDCEVFELEDLFNNKYYLASTLNTNNIEKIEFELLNY